MGCGGSTSRKQEDGNRKPDAPKPILAYWNLQGRASPARMMLHHLGVGFVDKQYKIGDTSVDGWAANKSKLGMVIPNLPYYQDGDIIHAETKSILRHIARKYRPDLMGRTPTEQAYADSFMNTLADTAEAFFGPYIIAQDYASKRDEGAKVAKAGLEQIVNMMNGKRFIASNNPTYCDFMGYQFCRLIKMYDAKVVADMPAIVQYMKNFEALNGIHKAIRSMESLLMFPPFTGWQKDNMPSNKTKMEPVSSAKDPQETDTSAEMVEITPKPTVSLQPKDLFSEDKYQPKGNYNPGKKEELDQMVSMHPPGMKYDETWVNGPLKEDGTRDTEQGCRFKYNTMFGQMFESAWAPYKDKCNTEKFTFDGTKYGSTWKEITVYRNIPKGITDPSKCPCIIFFHGSAFIFFDSSIFVGETCHLAFINNCVVYNMDYRKAPEFKCPDYIMDSYAGVKWVLEEQKGFYDPTRVALHGSSAGGHMIVGVAMEMAKRNECSQIKLLVPHIAAMSPIWLDYTPESPELNWVQQTQYNAHTDILKMMHSNWETAFQTKDPNLFPGNMPDDLLAKVPPMYLTTAEWEQYKIDNEWLAERLKKVGKFLGIFIEPGQTHGEIPHRELNKIFVHYLGCDEAPPLTGEEVAINYSGSDAPTGEILAPKNLFPEDKYQPKGNYNPGKKEELDQMVSMYPNDMKYDETWVIGPLKEDGTRDTEQGCRVQFNAMFAQMLEAWDPYKDKCNTEKFTFDGTKYGSTWKEITVYRNIPKGITDPSKCPCIIFFHGSAFLFFDSAMFVGETCHLAFINNCVVYNMDYRKAPEFKCPDYIMDSYAGVKWVLEEQKGFYDPARVALHGSSAGGHMIIGVAMELAKRNECSQIKLLVPHIAAMSAIWLDYTPESPELNWVQQKQYNGHVDVYKMMHNDWETAFRAKDPNLFPGNMPDDLLAKVPPMYLTTAEWDHYKIDNEWLAERLKKVSKFLGIFIEPGQTHGEIPHRELNKIFVQYLGCDEAPPPEVEEVALNVPMPEAPTGRKEDTLEPKNLFPEDKYQPKGNYNPGKKEELDQMVSMYPNDMKYDENWVNGPLKEDGTRDTEQGCRVQFNAMFAQMLEAWDPYKDKCNTEKFTFDGTKYGSTWKEITVYRSIPKGITDPSKCPCIIFFHGSAFLFFDSAMFVGETCHLAFINNCVVYNMDYRKAPEFKCPDYIMDSYAGVKWVLEEQKGFYDPTRVALHGSSAGGHMIIGVAMEMAKRNECSQIKLMVPHIAAMSAIWLDYTPESPELNWVQQKQYNGHVDVYKMMHNDWETAFRAKDPNLFPGNMPDDLLAKVPPMYLTTAEWDHYKIDNEWLAERLKKVGKFLGIFIEPGQIHGEIPHRELNKIFVHYIGCDEAPAPEGEELALNVPMPDAPTGRQDDSLAPKNLFEGPEYQLKGEYLEGKKEQLEGRHAMLSPDMKYDEAWILGPLKEDGTRDSDNGFRAQMNGMFTGMQAVFEPFKEKCNIEKFTIDGTKYGSTWNEITIYRNTPKDVEDVSKLPCMIFIHGSAFIIFNAEIFQGETCKMASINNCVVYNVDHRKAPEFKCPDYIMDCYAGAKWVLEEQKGFYDPTRVVLHGSSSGGHMVIGMAMEMAKRDECSQIKLVVPHIAAMSAVWLDYNPESSELNWVQKANWRGHTEILKMMHNDWETAFRTKDPNLFPGDMPEDLLKKVPPMYLTGAEWDQFKLDNEFFAKRLKKVGKLLGVFFEPGQIHGPICHEEIAKILKHYL